MFKQGSVRAVQLTLVLLGLCTMLSRAGAVSQEKKSESLYKRLGGYDAIAAVVDDFVPRLVNDPQLGKFFAGHGVDSKKRIRQLVVEQLCEACGGPCFYIGRSMKAAHGGLGITESDWQAAVNHLVAVLTKFSIPQKDELLAIATSLKPDIVSPPAVPAVNK